MSYKCKNPDCSAPENKKGKSYPSAMDCPFCDVPLVEEVSFSEKDLNLINSLPYVIAYPLKRTLSENHPWTRLNLFKDTFLNYLKYLGLLSASEFFSSSIKDKGMVALFHQNLTETAFGKWNHYIREVLKFLKENNHDFFCPEILAYYEQVEAGNKSVKYKGEIEFIDANGDVQLKKQEATAIGMLINFRNRYLGHGLTLDTEASERLWAEYFPIFRTLLEKMNFAQSFPMLKIEDGESWVLHSAEITRIENAGAKDENIWMQNPEGKYLSILPFFIVPGELAVGNTEKAKIFTYESYTGKTIKFFSPEGTEKQTSGKILERLNLLLRDKQKETPFSPDQFTKEIFLKRVEEENKILLDTLISEKKIIPGVYQHREDMEIKLREWIGARANIFFIAAEAGSGKTNLLAEIQKQYTERGYTTLMIRAGRMEKNSFMEQIAYLLNIDTSVGFEKYASIVGTQAEPTFILIDGLNEANNAESIWQEILFLSKSVEPGCIKFVITSRANSKADIERFVLYEDENDLLYGETKESEKGLDAHVFWLTPMNMKEMKGAWERYLANDKSRYKPLFSFDDIATFDRALYEQVNNPLVLRLFLEVYNGKALPKKGGKHLHIWQDWFNTFSTEEQTFFKLLADEVWLRGENELLLDDLLKNDKLKSYISSDLVNAPYTRLKNMGWVSRYMKDMNACLGFTVEGSLLYMLGKNLQQQIPVIDLAYIKNIIGNGNKLQRSAIESFLCEQALVGNLDLLTVLIDTEEEQMDLCIQPLLLFMKRFSAEETVKRILQNPTENDWKVILKFYEKITKLQLHSLRIDFIKLIMLKNPLKTRNEILIGLQGISVLDKELSLQYYNQIESNSSFIYDDSDFLFELGQYQMKCGFFDKALDLFQKSLDIQSLIPDREHHKIALCFDNIGKVLYFKCNYDEAFKFYEKSLNIRLKVLGGEHIDVATSYNFIGVAWDGKGDYEKALEFHEKSLNIRLKILGGEHPDVAASYNNLGLAFDGKADYETALEFHKKCLNIRLRIFGDEHPDVATSYNNIGVTLDTKRDCDKALEYYFNCLSIRLKIFGDEHLDVAEIFNNIGVACEGKGDYEKALEFHEKALGIELKILGAEHPKIAGCYNNIGVVYDLKGDYEKSLEFHNKSLIIRLKILGEEHPSVASSYNNIAVVYYQKGDYEKALEFHHKCLNIRLKILGNEHLDVAMSYRKIGIIFQDKGSYEKALDYHKKCLSIRLSIFGGEHSSVAISHHNIGIAFNSIGDYSKAFDHFIVCTTIWKKIFGLEHKSTQAAIAQTKEAAYKCGREQELPNWTNYNQKEE